MPDFFTDSTRGYWLPFVAFAAFIVYAALHAGTLVFSQDALRAAIEVLA